MNLQNLTKTEWWGSLYDRRIRSLWDKTLDYQPNWMKRWIINVTNACNHRCYSCSALCDKPYTGIGFRDEFRVTKPEHVEKWLALLDGYRPEYWVRLTGGEPTIAGPNWLRQVSETVHSHNRNISILTNGYQFMDCDPWWFDQITFDNHIINKALIDECLRLLKKEGYPEYRYKVATNKVHRNLQAQRETHTTQGFNCKDWLENISLWREVVYPCCVIYYLDGWDQTDAIRDSLLEAGWHVENPHLRETIENWRTTIPAEVARACLLSCWKQGPIEEYHPVTEAQP